MTQAHLANLTLDDRSDSWELLSHGTLSREEAAFLRALSDESPKDATRFEAYAPLDARFHERMTDTLLAQVSSRRNTRPRVRQLTTASLLLAAAASLLLMVRPVATRAPEYELTVRGQIAYERGAPAVSSAAELVPDSVLDIRLTPVERGAERQLSTFLQQDGKVIAWPVPISRASSGAFRITGRARDLLGSRYGEWDAVFVLGPDRVTQPPNAAEEQGDLTVKRARLHYRKP